MGPTGDATLPMLLADSEATLGETGGALDTAIEQIALWVGQQLHDTQTSLTAVKAKLTKWANRALQTTGATLNDVVAVLQQNAAAYVNPQQNQPPNGPSTTFPGAFPAAPVVTGTVPPSLSEAFPPQQGSNCGVVAYTAVGDPNPPSDPLPPGCEWYRTGVIASGMVQWCYRCTASYTQPVTVGGVSGAGQQGTVLSGVTSGQTCLRYRLDGSCATYPEACISPSPFAPYTDWEELYFTDPRVNGTANNTAGFYSAQYASQSVGGQCVSAVGGGPAPVAVTAPTPCELPPDVASWPGQRVVQIPFDLNQGGAASAWGECGQLMLKDAIGQYYPTQKYLDAIATGDVVKAVFPWTVGVTGIGNGVIEER